MPYDEDANEDDDDDDDTDDDDTENDNGFTSLSRETCLLFSSGEALARFPRGAPRLRSRLLLSSPSILPKHGKVHFFSNLEQLQFLASFAICMAWIIIVDIA